MSQSFNDEFCARRSRPGRSFWHPVELIAMIIGFIVWWPIGLGILGLKLWQRSTDHQGDLVDAAQGLCMQGGRWARDKAGSMNFSRGGDFSRGWRDGPSRWSRGGPASPTGNSAFDDWRSAELAKLEEQRRKLVDAEREFAEHIDGLRRARDREEFDRFMQARNTPTPGNDSPH